MSGTFFKQSVKPVEPHNKKNSDPAALSAKIDLLLAEMTLEEKAALCSGKDVWHTKSLGRLGIPDLFMADGPHGVRKQDRECDNFGLSDSVPATCFPTASALACSWNRGLMHEIGVALGEECLQEGVDLLLGPGINMKRSPLCGRNFEYFSEDPYLTAELAIPLINGLQTRGPGACLKHFAVNNQEKYRMTVSAQVDERALNEIYLSAFERTIMASGPRAVMTSYNRINGVYAGESIDLISNTLRKRWNYNGLVVTDWGAVNDRVAGIMAGSDLEMPSSGKANDPLLIRAAKENPAVSVAMDDSIRRILTLAFKSRQNRVPGYRCSTQEHHALARKAAAESIVLLKNDASLLPLPENAKIALIGQFAKYPRYQGAGSSLVHPTQLESLYHFARENRKDRVSYADGYPLDSDQIDPELVSEAKTAAAMADIAIIVAGLPESYESEGFDRTHLNLPPNHDHLIREVAAVNKKTVVVLQNGAPVEMPWICDIPVVVENYLSGQAGGSALWEILTGRVSPSGKLAESFPLRLCDTPSYNTFPMGPEQVDYREGIFIGYRHYEKAGLPVLFPFGHGLSYTTFEYGAISADPPRIDFERHKFYQLSISVKNTGAFPGMETVQLYVHNPFGEVIRPEKELRGFNKVFLLPGEKKELHFSLDQSAFSFYSTTTHQWNPGPGLCDILLGSSSADIRIAFPLEIIISDPIVKPDGNPESVNNNKAAHDNLTKSVQNDITKSVQEDFAKKENKNFHANSTMGECRQNVFFRFLYFCVLQYLKKRSRENPRQFDMMRAVLEDLPIKRLVIMSNGIIRFRHIDAFVFWMNKERYHALKTLLGISRKS